MPHRNPIHAPHKSTFSAAQEKRCEIDQKILMSPPLPPYSVFYRPLLKKISKAWKPVLLSLDLGLEEMPRGADDHCLRT